MRIALAILLLLSAGCTRRLELNVRDARIPRQAWLDQKVSVSGYLFVDRGTLYLAEASDVPPHRALPLTLSLDMGAAEHVASHWENVRVDVRGIYRGHLVWGGVPPGHVDVEAISKSD